jgi:hypothetical protein
MKHRCHRELKNERKRERRRRRKKKNEQEKGGLEFVPLYQEVCSTKERFPEYSVWNPSRRDLLE